MIYKAVCLIIDNITHKDICLIAYSKLYIWKVIHQLAQNCIHQIALLKLLYHWVEYLAIWHFLFW